jgi:hypothetical protein
MRKICTFLSISLFSVTAFAQAGKPEKPEPAAKPAETGKPAVKPADAAAKPAEPAKPADAAPPAGAAMGKPAEEIKAMAKDMIGVWKCEGKMNMGGKEQKDTGKMVFTSELDGHFIGGRYESPKTKENPAGFKAKSMIGFDPASKMFVSSGQDNMGGWAMAQSKGFEGDTLTWTGKAKMMGADMDTKETITRKGPREVSLTGSMTGGGQTMSWESTCKK